MPSIHPQYRNELQASMLFLADKYRKMGDLARRFNDTAIIERASLIESQAREVAALCIDDTIVLNVEQMSLSVSAINGFIDEINRAVQAAQMRGLLEQSTQLEHKLRSLYAARASLIAGRLATAPGTDAASVIERAASAPVPAAAPARRAARPAASTGGSGEE